MRDKCYKMKMKGGIYINRIMIFGRPGSGKSTFALKLHKRTGIPLYHLDRYFFVENWIERDYAEFLRIQEDIVDNKEWIIDGNSIRSLEVRYACADICLFFNYPKARCLWRILKRVYDKKNIDINDRAEGCSERFSWKLIRYMWNFRARVNDKVNILRQRYPNVIFIEVKNDNDLPIITRLYSDST